MAVLRRDLVAWFLSIPSALTVIACLFLPVTHSCHGGELTAVDSGLAAIMVPVAALGLLPLAWRVLPAIRRGAPEIMMTVAALVLMQLVITIPIAVALVWSHARHRLRGEALTAVSSVLCVIAFLVVFPLITMFDTWLLGARLVWAAAGVEALGLAIWASAARARDAHAYR
ncbi:MAG: hypothetical protein M3680_14780 [Myxococcota bacterium]|nr:hypothetical protein [Myxococcota bacterium]